MLIILVHGSYLHFADDVPKISGTAANLVGNDGCFPANQGGRMCASIDQTVTISCNSHSYKITGPRLIATNRSLNFVVTSADYGIYSCNSSCGLSTISLERLHLPSPNIKTLTVQCGKFSKVRFNEHTCIDILLFISVQLLVVEG